MKLNIGLSALACVLLAACGGGGGGSSEPVQSSIADAVRVSNVTPASINQSVVESRTPMAGVEIGANLTGDLARLAGQTVFVLIEDARGLFEVASTFISPTGVGNTVSLRLKSTLGLSGAVEGTLRLNVCLDAACASPLGNSPSLIPYRIEVFPGVKATEAGPISVEVAFGAPDLPGMRGLVVSRNLSLAVPANLGSPSSIPPFEVDWIGQSGAGSSRIAALTYGTVTPGQTIDAQLLFPLRPVGTYVSQLLLGTFVRNPSGTSGTAESRVEVRYTVRDSGVPIAYQATRADFVEREFGQFVTVTGANGALYDRVGRIVYSPGSGAIQWLALNRSTSDADSLSRQFEVFADKCGTSAFTTCLPSGTYSAEVYFQTSAGVESPIPWRATLRVL